MKKYYGVIDIGTLKVKLQIVEKSQTGELKTIEQSNILTCLGCHMAENGNRPKPENLEKLFAELSRCKKLMQKYGVKRMRVVSTHALREMAEVGTEIAKEIKKKNRYEHFVG